MDKLLAIRRYASVQAYYVEHAGCAALHRAITTIRNSDCDTLISLTYLCPNAPTHIRRAPHNGSAELVVHALPPWTIAQRSLQLAQRITQEIAQLMCWMPSSFRMEILKDIWEAEAAFCQARHKVATAFMDAYEQAASWGIAELRPPPGIPSPEPGGNRGVSSAGLLGARSYLRTVIVETLFRLANTQCVISITGVLLDCNGSLTHPPALAAKCRCSKQMIATRCCQQTVGSHIINAISNAHLVLEACGRM